MVFLCDKACGSRWDRAFWGVHDFRVFEIDPPPIALSGSREVGVKGQEISSDVWHIPRSCHSLAFLGIRVNEKSSLVDNHEDAKARKMGMILNLF